ncbi:MAG: DUF4279 domain-containing protein [Caulobacteraceae bacterium]
MAGLARTVAMLRILGDDLDPDAVSRLLGARPTAGARKGDVRLSASGREVVARSGSWRLRAEDHSPGDLSTQIRDLLTKLTDNLAVWRELSRRYRCDIFCGLFMSESNEGGTLEPDVLSMLGDRGLPLGLDIHDASPD